MSPTQVFYHVPLISLSLQRANKLGGDGSSRMAAASGTRRPRQLWSMNDLSSELLALIFEQVGDPPPPFPGQPRPAWTSHPQKPWPH
jgi:hypothetical protein